MEHKVTCQHTITVSENEYKLLYRLRMLANRARREHREEMVIVRITAAEVKCCEVKWNGNGGGPE